MSHWWHLPTAVQSLLALIVQHNQIPESKDLFSYFLAILSWSLSKSMAVQAEDEQTQEENSAPLVFGMVQPLCFSSLIFRAMSVLTVGDVWDGITLFSLFWAISAVWGFPSHITQLFSSLYIWGRVGGRLNKSNKTPLPYTGYLRHGYSFTLQYELMPYQPPKAGDCSSDDLYLSCTYLIHHV